MTIDEVIAHEREVAKKNREICRLKTRENAPSIFKCAEEHEQLAEWLEELKAIKSDGFTDDLLNMGFTKGYNKAIDDFAEKAIKIVYESNNRDRNPQPRDMVADIHYKLLEISEQLKAGGKNEQSI